MKSLYTTVSFTEDFSTLDIPLFVKYEYVKGKWKPVAQYQGNDLVTLDGNTYVALSENR